MTKNALRIGNSLNTFERKNTQEQQVIDALVKCGGSATFAELYHSLEKNFEDWETKTPQASVRRIVQQSSACYKIVPGFWGLKDFRKQLESDGFSKENDAWTHSFYQGLLVELGNMKEGIKTYVPAQDGRKVFRKNLCLRKLADTTEIPKFSFRQIVDRARTVDVVWFKKSNNMPHSFFEVEHTTDCQNSLLKFVDLADFCADFEIVAPAFKKSKFEEILNRSAFASIRTRVKFWDYKKLVDVYEKKSALARLGYE